MFHTDDTPLSSPPPCTNLHFQILKTQPLEKAPILQFDGIWFRKTTAADPGEYFHLRQGEGGHAAAIECVWGCPAEHEEGGGLLNLRGSVGLSAALLKSSEDLCADDDSLPFLGANAAPPSVLLYNGGNTTVPPLYTNNAGRDYFTVNGAFQPTISITQGV